MFTYRYFPRCAVILAIAALASSPSFAGVMINKTRIIYDANDKSATSTLSNVSGDNYAVQVWVNGASDRSDEQVPFIATPALFRIAPSEDQIIKIIKLPDNTLSKDRESVFYFNAQEIPSIKKGQNANKLTIAIRSRIKIFYRPAGLKGKPEDAIEKLSWQRIYRDGKTWLRATNNTPWNISFSEINFVAEGKSTQVKTPEMLTPFSHEDYYLSASPLGQKGNVVFSVINDYGGIKQYQNVLER